MFKLNVKIKICLYEGQKQDLRFEMLECDGREKQDINILIF